MRISAALPQGVAALFGQAAVRRRRLEQRMVAVLEEAGFAEVVLPILDYMEPYEPLLTAADRGELYRFVDRDGELLALRGDFTPMLARLLAPMLARGSAPGSGSGAGAGQAPCGGLGSGPSGPATGPASGARRGLDLPLRLFYRGDVVRYEPEHAGRQRELFQVGAEVLGVPGREAERTVLATCLRLLAATAPAPQAGPGAGTSGAAAGPRLRVVLGFAGALDRPLQRAAAAGAEPAEIVQALRRRERRALRALGTGPGAGSRGAEAGRPADAGVGAGARSAAAAEAPGGSAPCLLGDEPAPGDVLLAVAEGGVPERPDDLGPDAAERLAALLRLRDEMAAEHPGVALSVDLAEFAGYTLAPSLAAALVPAPAAAPAAETGGDAGEGSYYDGLVFRVYAGDSALPAGAGGRYDRLFRRLGAEVPAAGFSLGLDRLADGARARVRLASGAPPGEEPPR